MTVESDKGLRNLKNIRRRYDTLLKDFGGKRPSNYGKMREFLIELIQIVDQETTEAGLAQSPTFELPNKSEIKKHNNTTTKDKGAVVLRTKAEIDAVGNKKDPGTESLKKEKSENVFVDDPSSFKLRDEIDKEFLQKVKATSSSIETIAEKRLEDDPDSKGLSDAELESIETTI